MECYALAQVCKQRGIEFQSYKWVSDDGTPTTWEENAKIGFENFTQIFNKEYFQNYFDM
jgi:nucleoside phosphorylase